MKGYIKALILILFCLAVLIPFASSDPDGLEKVADTMCIKETESISGALMPNYTISVVEMEYGSTLIAGVVGVLLVFGTAFILGKLVGKRAN